MPRHHALLGLLALLPLAANSAYRFDIPDYLALLPEQTYHIVEHSFSTLYQQTDFTPQVTNSYFNNSNLYKFVGVPLVISTQSGFQLEVFGQELNPESYAICKSDMLIKGQNPANIKFGDSFTQDGLEDEKFDYMLSNPPFGVEWKKSEKKIIFHLPI